MTMLDQVIFPVRSTVLKSSFHPKIWLLRFDRTDGKHDSKFRLLVASRNLSKQMDWEIGCALDGYKAKTADGIANGLRLFIKGNEQSVPKTKTKLAKEILEDLSRMTFSIPTGIKSASFLYKNAGKKVGPWINPKDYRELIIVSPFLTPAIVESFAKDIANPDKFYLVTTPLEAYKLKDIPQVHTHSYVFDPGEVTIENSGVATDGKHCDITMGLHAKIYLGQRTDGTGTDVFLGSANCTSNGLHGPNTEAMMLLRQPQSIFREFLTAFIFQNLKKEVPHNWLRKYSELSNNELASAKEKATLEKKLSEIRAALAMGEFILNVRPRLKEATLAFRSSNSFEIPKDVRAKVCPWECPSWKPFETTTTAEGASFKNAEGFHSDFIHVVLSCQGETLQFMSVAKSNINKSERNGAILRKYLRDHDDFFQYLMLILKSPEFTKAGSSGERTRCSRKISRPSQLITETGFLEDVLVKASHNNSVIQQINVALDAVNLKSAPMNAFREFWRDFCSAHNEAIRDA
jgi:hypothetical protein